MTSQVDNSAFPVLTIDPFSGQNYLTMTVKSYFAPPDTVLTAQFSGDLKTWSPGVIVSNTTSLLKVRDNTGNAPARFMRLQVTRP